MLVNRIVGSVGMCDCWKWLVMCDFYCFGGVLGRVGGNWDRCGC